MTQAAISNTTRVADAILALINSRPRTPTRDEIVSALAKFRPEASNANRPDYPRPLPPLRMRPTELGWELIEKLMPAYLEAVQYSSTCLSSDPDAEAFEAAESEASDALWNRKMAATELVDLAIAYRIAIDGETPPEKLKTAKAN